MKHSKQSIDSLLSKLAYKHGIRDVFNDLLDFAIMPLVYQDHGNLSKNPLSKYSPDEQKLFVEMLQVLGDSMEDYNDGLGDLFMEYLSFGKNGQFFTPQPICDLMAQLTYSENAHQEKERTSVADCACGSGRTLLAAAKMKRNQFFYGSDVDLTCVKMTVINLAYNSLVGEVHWMNALTLEHYGSFSINVEPITKLPFIITQPADKSSGAHLIKETAKKMPEHQKEQVKQQLQYIQKSLFDD